MRRSSSAVVLGSVLALAAAESQRVTSLPGVGAINGTHFAGNITVPYASSNLTVFYYLAQHEDLSAPLIVWMNGGPGASSLMGLFTELGPYLINERSVRADGGWALEANPHAWSAVGSLLVWEQPAGVGFSACDTDDGACGFVWDDDSSADANLAFLVAFFDMFPAERERALYITGESYGGIYVPVLAARVAAHNLVARDDARIALRGIAVGNGCVGYGVAGGCGLDALELFVTSLEQASPDADRATLAAARAACDGELDVGSAPEDLSDGCRSAVRAVFLEAAEFNTYHLASACGPDGQGNWGDGDGFACSGKPTGGGDGALQRYLGDAATQAALHALADAGDAARAWRTWDGDSALYDITLADATPVYASLLADETNCSVLVYNGLRDAGVPHQGAQKWVPAVGGALVAPRRAWGTPPDGVLAGHVTSFAPARDAPSGGGVLTYATVQGAGHLVPADRPATALAMISSFVRGEPLPPYEGVACKPLWTGRGYMDFCA